MADFVARSNLFVPQEVGRPPIEETGNPIPVRDWEQNYFKPPDPDLVPRGLPVMRGRLYVPEPPVDPPDIVPKSYVDGLLAGEADLSSIWQPYIVGNLWMGNFMTTMAGGLLPRPTCRLSIGYLSEAYNFDQARLNIWMNASPGAIARLGMYSVDPETLLPTSLLDDFGVVDLSSNGEKIIAITKTYGPGMYGLAVQNENGSSNPGFTFDMCSNYCSPYGWLAPTVGIGTIQYAFQIGVATVIPGALPLPGVWAYTQLQQWGGGLALRRAA